MNNKNGGFDCTWGSFVMAALIAVLAAIVMRFFAELSWTGAIFVGLIALVVLGLLFNWIFCRDLPALGEVEAPGAGASTSNATATASASSGAAGAAASAGAAAAATAASSAAKSADAAPKVKSSQLSGQDELAGRKGEWSYDGGDDAKAAPAAAAAPADEDYDGDGVVEGKDEGQRPEGLTEARGGKADNLKEIKGIGPKLEKLCNRLGFYHFDQIAAWSSDEIAWVDANLEGFKGRVSRDKWVEQAKVLAAGGETEFSKRVEGGKVY